MSAPTSTRRGRAGVGMHERFRDRRAQVRADARRRRRTRILALAGAVALAAAVVATALSPLLTISTVVVRGAEGGLEPAVRDALRVRPGDHLLRADLGAAERRVRALPAIAWVQTHRAPPSTLEVTVAVRAPAAVVRLADQSWVVDGEGVVLAGGAAELLPHVDAPDATLPLPGDATRDPGVRAALAVLDDLPADLALRVERIEADAPRDLQVRIGPGPTGTPGALVRWGAPEDTRAKARAVRLLLGERDAPAPRFDPAATLLDVRAPDNPVVVPRG